MPRTVFPANRVEKRWLGGNTQGRTPTTWGGLFWYPPHLTEHPLGTFVAGNISPTGRLLMTKKSALKYRNFVVAFTAHASPSLVPGKDKYIVERFPKGRHVWYSHWYLCGVDYLSSAYEGTVPGGLAMHGHRLLHS